MKFLRENLIFFGQVFFPVTIWMATFVSARLYGLFCLGRDGAKEMCPDPIVPAPARCHNQNRRPSTQTGGQGSPARNRWIFWDNTNMFECFQMFLVAGVDVLHSTACALCFYNFINYQYSLIPKVDVNWCTCLTSRGPGRLPTGCHRPKRAATDPNGRSGLG